MGIILIMYIPLLGFGILLTLQWFSSNDFERLRRLLTSEKEILVKIVSLVKV